MKIVYDFIISWIIVTLVSVKFNFGYSCSFTFTGNIKPPYANFFSIKNRIM